MASGLSILCWLWDLQEPDANDVARFRVVLSPVSSPSYLAAESKGVSSCGTGVPSLFWVPLISAIESSESYLPTAVP